MLSIDDKKAFDKVQHTFLIKTLHSVGIKGTYLNVIRVMYEKPSEYHSQWGKTENFSPKVRNMAGLSTITTAIQQGTRSPSFGNHTPERNKRYPVSKSAKKKSNSQSLQKT